MHLIDRSTYFYDHLLCSLSGQSGLGLLQDHNAILFVAVNSKGNSSVPTQLRMSLLCSKLDILGMNITSADDDNILYPAGHEQLTVVNKSEVAGSQEDALLIGDQRMKAIKGSRVLIVVAACNTLASNPDLADRIWRPAKICYGIDDRNLCP